MARIGLSFQKPQHGMTQTLARTFLRRMFYFYLSSKDVISRPTGRVGDSVVCGEQSESAGQGNIDT